MALTVRFPNGQAVTYNGAYWCEYGSVTAILRDKKNGQWICSIPLSSGAIIESVRPCSVSNPLTANGLESAIDLLLSGIKQNSQWTFKGKVGELKKLLEGFNRKRRTWK